MFTGIIEEVGRIAALDVTPAGGRLRVQAQKVRDRLGVGSSIAVNGVCLTVTSLVEGSFCVDLSDETVRRTSFRNLGPGRGVNLELPLTPSTPLGGHIVQGHVDGTAVFLSLDPSGENYWLRVEVAPELGRYLVEKGSVAIEGISLTVAALQGAELGVAVIPYTYENTNLREFQRGELVNIECDVLAKYVEKLLGTERTTREAREAKITLSRLLEEGF